MPHVNSLPPQTISKLSPLSGLIVSIVLVIYFLLRYYVLERLLPRMYGESYTCMSIKNRRSFLNNHIAGGVKIFILIMAAYPFLAVAFGTSTFHTPLMRKDRHDADPTGSDAFVTMGDVLVVAAQMLVAMYVFELFYRDRISPVSVAHHIGTILIAESAIAISLGRSQEKDASIEFMLCTVWGAFDIVAEFLPHLSLILYRLHPNRPRFLVKLFRLACLTELAGTTSETAVTMWLFGSLWHRWTLAFKIVTPLLHCLFAAAQLWGAYVFWRLWRKQVKILAGEIEDEERNRPEDEQYIRTDQSRKLESQSGSQGEDVLSVEMTLRAGSHEQNTMAERKNY